MDQNLVFQHVCAFPSVKVHVYAIRTFWSANLHVNATWSMRNLRIPLFLQSVSLNYDLSSE